MVYVISDQRYGCWVLKIVFWESRFFRMSCSQLLCRNHWSFSPSSSTTVFWTLSTSIQSGWMLYCRCKLISMPLMFRHVWHVTHVIKNWGRRKLSKVQQNTTQFFWRYQSHKSVKNIMKSIGLKKGVKKSWMLIFLSFWNPTSPIFIFYSPFFWFFLEFIES